MYYNLQPMSATFADPHTIKHRLFQGVYRVSGVKSRVEKLCQSFEIEGDKVDLSEHHPNVISNVLKLYLRQLPEPLLPFSLYPEFIKCAKVRMRESSLVLATPLGETSSFFPLGIIFRKYPQGMFSGNFRKI